MTYTAVPSGFSQMRNIRDETGQEVGHMIDAGYGTVSVWFQETDGDLLVGHALTWELGVDLFTAFAQGVAA